MNFYVPAKYLIFSFLGLGQYNNTSDKNSDVKIANTNFATEQKQRLLFHFI